MTNLDGPKICLWLLVTTLKGPENLLVTIHDHFERRQKFACDHFGQTRKFACDYWWPLCLWLLPPISVTWNKSIFGQLKLNICLNTVRIYILQFFTFQRWTGVFRTFETLLSWWNWWSGLEVKWHSILNYTIRTQMVFSYNIFYRFFRTTLVHGNKAKLKSPSLASLRCKSKFEIFELGLIAVQINLSNFRAWPYCSANWFSNFSSLALLPCTSILYQIIPVCIFRSRTFLS